jgi:arginine/lysine/ornithine decarboxylase
MGIISDNLDNLIESDVYPFHMPGGKRAKTALKKDITEIDGFDDLHNPKGIIKEAQDNTAKIYGSKKCFFLVNGSTCGILAAISACTKEGDEIIIGKNAHRSVYNAVELRSLTPRYIMPRMIPELLCLGAVTSEQVKEAVENYKDAKAVVLTSPTYEGELGDMDEIAKICHDNDKILIVDEAHGAHLYFDEYFPKGAIYSGADIVIQSVHKTLAALTQGALLHINSDRVDEERVKKYLSIYQTSSPSYILMSSIEDAVEEAYSNKQMWKDYSKRLEKFYSSISQCKVARVMCSEDRDRGKIVLYHKDRVNMGNRLAEILRNRYHLECEYSSLRYVLLMTSVMDTDEGFDRLTKAILELDEEYADNELSSYQGEFNDANMMYEKHPSAREAVMIPAKAAYMDYTEVNLFDSVGMISKENLYIYPPGRAFVVAGERITDWDMWYMLDLMQSGFEVRGIRDGKVRIIGEP